MSKLCDQLAHALRHAPGELDKECLVACGQIATAFFISIEKKVPIRVQIRMDTAGSSPLIEAVHPKWLLFVEALSKRPTGKTWLRILKKTVGLNPLSIVPICTIAGKRVEAWIGDMTVMVTTCDVCKKRYSTTINAQRCIQGHSTGAKTVADKAATISRAWDALGTEERVSLFSKFHEMSQNHHGPISDIVMNPGKVSAEELCEALQENSEGTFFAPYGRHPVPDLLQIEDEIALLAYRIETTLVAHARELSGLDQGDQKSAKSIKRFVKKFKQNIPEHRFMEAVRFVNEFKKDIPENRFLQMVWMAQIKGFNYDSEQYLVYKNREIKPWVG